MLFVQAMYSMQLLFDLHIPCHRLIYMFETDYEMSMLQKTTSDMVLVFLFYTRHVEIHRGRKNEVAYRLTIVLSSDLVFSSNPYIMLLYMLLMVSSNTANIVYYSCLEKVIVPVYKHMLIKIVVQYSDQQVPTTVDSLAPTKHLFQ